MKKIQDINVGDQTTWFEGGFFEITKSKSYVAQDGDKQVLIVECVFNGDKEKAEQYLQAEFGYPVRIESK